MEALRLRSFAKINLSLKILGLRADGYHEIDSQMQTVSLCDEIELSVSGSGVSVRCDSPLVPSGEANIAYRAARHFLDFCKIDAGLNVNINKRIPVAAGLAGGSSNAAAVLNGCDILFKTALSRTQISSLGADVGSDVPFCLVGGRARIRGRGEIVEQLSILPKMHFVLVVPDIKVPTKWAYEEFDRWAMRKKGTMRHLEPRDSANETFMNDFEEAISSKFPEIKRIKQVLLSAGSTAASMSGSGPAVYGLAQDEAAAKRISEVLLKDFPRTFVVSNVNYGLLAL